jgi:uncharacterized protein (DUF1684 family)
MNKRINTVNVRNNLPMSEVIRRKSRMIGSDDLSTAANVCKWAENEGIRGPMLQMAASLAKAFEDTLLLSAQSKHYEAAKKAKSTEYVLKHNSRLARLSIPCRDGKRRTLDKVVGWFADRHFRIAQDIEEAQASEAKIAAQVAEIQAVADAAQKNADRVSTKLQAAKKVA